MKHLIVLSCFVLFLGCKEELHPLLADDDKALSLLLDLNFANIAVNKYPTLVRDSAAQDFKSQICRIHNLKEEELDSVIWLMQNDFDRYSNLYDMLKDSLENLEERLSDEAGTQARIPYKQLKDSLKLKQR